MIRTLRVLLCLSVMVGCGLRTSAQQIEWVKTWAEARKIATEQKKPIMVHFNMDNEPACEGIARTHFHQQEIVEQSKKFVCVLGSLGEHGKESIIDAPKDSKICRRFGCVTCSDHQNSEIAARLAFMESNTVTAPQFVFLTPDLHVLARRVYELAPGDLLKMMKRALAYYQPDSGEAGDKKLLQDLFGEAQSGNADRRKSAVAALASRDEPEVVEFFLAQTSPDIDETRRKDAIRAIAGAKNANVFPRLCALLKDRSAAIRAEATKALYDMGMSEAAKPLLEAYGVETSLTAKALLLRTAAGCAPFDKDVAAMLDKALTHPKQLIRQHAAYALSVACPDHASIKKLAAMAKSDSDPAGRAVAAYACATVNRRYKNPRSGRDRVRASQLDVGAVEKDVKTAIKQSAEREADANLKNFLLSLHDAVEKNTVIFTDALDYYFVADEIFKVVE